LFKKQEGDPAMKHEIWIPPVLPGLGKLSNRDGIPYMEFRKSLSTNYKRVQTSIYLTWILILLLVAWASTAPSVFLAFLLLPPLSLLQHRILTTLHEGAHFHLAKNRKTNDFFTNLLAGWFTLNSVQVYRKIHLEHHRFLGEEEDPESSYMEKLDLTWLLTAIIGAKTLKAFFTGKYFIPRKVSSSSVSVKQNMFFVGLISHGMLLILLFSFDSIAALVWSISTFFVLPFLSLLRNLLEHKYVESVEPELLVYLASQNLGIESRPPSNPVTTRIFTLSRLSQLYGSMGFSRHLVHHWDPSISFQNLGKVHEFLLETPIGIHISNVDTTSSKVFTRLWRKNVS